MVEDEEGTYWLMYTAFDGHVARLSVGDAFVLCVVFSCFGICL